MLSGWLAQGRAGDHFSVVDPKISDEMATLLEHHQVPHFEIVPKTLSPSLVIIAVKPQMMQKVLPTLAPLAQVNPVFVSVAAGTAISTFQETFGQDAAVVRAMPNTPAQVGRGITIGFATTKVNNDQRQLVGDLLAVTGAFDWVDEERLIDAVTAVSGSGPAYVFYMVEALAAAAMETGLAPDLALTLARKTVEGAGELLYQSSEEASVLRQNVTSPGGTTAAALEVLMADDGLRPLMERAVLAAQRRAEALAEE